VSYTALPTKNPGDILTSALWNTYLQGNADSGFMRMLADTTLGAGAASIEFASIPATFAHLMLLIEGRGDAASLAANLLLRLNNDSGASQYTYGILNSGGAAAGGADNASATSFFAGVIAAATATAAFSGLAAIWIPHYAGTTFLKRIQSQYGAQYATTAGNLNHGVSDGFWNSSAAVNRVTLLPASGNFVAGTRATLYGLPA
jgi:hypothetical protein